MGNRKDVRARNDWVLCKAEENPDMIIPFVTIIEDDVKAPKMFNEYIDRGAKGLKLIGWHSNYIKKYDYDLKFPSLMEVFRIAAKRCVPVLFHLWIGYSETKHDYLADLRTILTEIPELHIVLAHFALGFDPETMKGLVELMEQY